MNEVGSIEWYAQRTQDLLDERDEQARELEALQSDYNEAMTTVSKLSAMVCTLRDLVINGAADDSDEAEQARAIGLQALELIGVPMGLIEGTIPFEDPKAESGNAPEDLAVSERPPVRVFRDSLHYAAFENRDCCNCVKYSPDASKCDLMYELAVASVNGGTVPANIADRLRPKDETHPHCGEFERAESAATLPPSE